MFTFLKNYKERQIELGKVKNLKMGEFYFPKTVFRDINGISTKWPAKHTSIFQRIVYRLYKKYVNHIYLPEKTDIHFVGINKDRIVIRKGVQEIYRDI